MKFYLSIEAFGRTISATLDVDEVGPVEAIEPQPSGLTSGWLERDDFRPDHHWVSAVKPGQSVVWTGSTVWGPRTVIGMTLVHDRGNGDWEAVTEDGQNFVVAEVELAETRWPTQ